MRAEHRSPVGKLEFPADGAGDCPLPPRTVGRQGLPERLAGKAIPLAARIVAIADVYDALPLGESTRKPIPHETCVEIIKHGAGKSFDPGIVAVFVELQSEFRDIAQWHKDTSKTVNAEPPCRGKRGHRGGERAPERRRLVRRAGVRRAVHGGAIKHHSFIKHRFGGRTCRLRTLNNNGFWKSGLC